MHEKMRHTAARLATSSASRSQSRPMPAWRAAPRLAYGTVRRPAAAPYSYPRQTGTRHLIILTLIPVLILAAFESWICGARNSCASEPS